MTYTFDESWSVKARGVGTLASGLCTVPTQAVQADSVIMVTPIAGSPSLGTLVVVGFTAGQSFIVGSTNAQDSSGFYWIIV